MFVFTLIMTSSKIDIAVVLPSPTVCQHVHVIFREDKQQINIILEQQNRESIVLTYKGAETLVDSIGINSKGPGTLTFDTKVERKDGILFTNIELIPPVSTTNRGAIAIHEEYWEDLKNILKGYLLIWKSEMKLKGIPRPCNHICCRNHSCFKSRD